MTSLFFETCVLFVLAVWIHNSLCHVWHSEKFVFRGLLFEGVYLFSAYFLSVDRYTATQAAFISFVFVCLWNLYLIFFINLQNSVSLRIAVAVFDKGQGKMALSGVNQHFPTAEGFESRLLAMRRNGFVEQVGQKLILTPKGRTFARIYRFMRRVFALPV